jgi:2-deoxystreptamine N-acetyl-D-glucosaminyltransferase/2-deoxystreptamine glucosyltransferase
MKVLRLCSVFEPDPATLAGRGIRFDPIGGMQNHTASLTRALDALGFDQTVVTSRLGGPTGVAPFAETATVVRVGAPIRHLRQLWALGAARHLAAAGRRFDLVHAHQGEDLALLPLAGMAARRCGAPLVITIHCSVRHTVAPVSTRTRVVRALGAPIERSALRRADRVLTLTRRTVARVVADGIDPARVRVIPSGFEDRVFGPWDGRRVGRPAGSGPRIGYVGRLAPQKDVVGIVRAFERMRTPDARLVIVGDGPDAARVDAAVAGSPRRSCIERVGFVPHDEVPGVLAGLDVMVLASRYEELGSVLVEGLRAGVAIVATDVGGIGEVVLDGETGLLVPPDDPDALAAAVDRVLGDPAAAGRLRERARRAAAAYSWDGLAARVAAEYEALVPPATRRSGRRDAVTASPSA